MSGIILGDSVRLLTNNEEKVPLMKPNLSVSTFHTLIAWIRSPKHLNLSTTFNQELLLLFNVFFLNIYFFRRWGQSNDVAKSELGVNDVAFMEILLDLTLDWSKLGNPDNRWLHCLGSAAEAVMEPVLARHYGGLPLWLKVCAHISLFFILLWFWY